MQVSPDRQPITGHCAHIANGTRAQRRRRKSRGRKRPRRCKNRPRLHALGTCIHHTSPTHREFKSERWVCSPGGVQGVLSCEEAARGDRTPCDGYARGSPKLAFVNPEASCEAHSSRGPPGAAGRPSPRSAGSHAGSDVGPASCTTARVEAEAECLDFASTSTRNSGCMVSRDTVVAYQGRASNIPARTTVARHPRRPTRRQSAICNGPQPPKILVPSRWVECAAVMVLAGTIKLDSGPPRGSVPTSAV